MQEAQVQFLGQEDPMAKGMAVNLFQILKDDAMKVLHSICQQIWGTQQWPQDWIQSIFIPTPKKGNAKECSNYHTIALISHTSKVMLKILQARLQQYMNRELPDVQAGFRKGRGTRDQIAFPLYSLVTLVSFKNIQNLPSPGRIKYPSMEDLLLLLLSHFSHV